MKVYPTQCDFDEPGPDFFWEYTCATCLAKEMGTDLFQARLYILQNVPGTQSRALRFEQFNFDCVNVQRSFNSRLSAKDKREISWLTMTEIFLPIADYIIQKREQMQRLEESNFEEHKAMALQLAVSTVPCE